MIQKFDPRYLAHSHYISKSNKIYLGYFGCIPDIIRISDLELEKLWQEFPLHFKEEIQMPLGMLEVLYEEPEISGSYLLQEEILVVLNDICEILYQKRTPLVERLKSFFMEFRKKASEESQIHLVVMGREGFENKRLEFKKPDLDFEQMYHGDFPAFHHRMLGLLEQEQQSGLHLLYGKPGTGKSSYIKYLCSVLKKKVIFLPGQLAQNLDHVSMTNYLISNSGAILVIEDAEELIISRGQQRNSNLAMVLNLTDGILGECLGIQIIATFNTDLRNLDPALKRKGRLRSSYEFRALPVPQVNALLTRQGIGRPSDRELTLAEIFNIKEEEQFHPQRQAVGFK